MLVRETQTLGGNQWSDDHRAFVDGCLRSVTGGEHLTREQARRLLLLFLDHEGPQVDASWGFAFGTLAGRGCAPSLDEARGYLDAIASYEKTVASSLFAAGAPPASPTLTVTGSGKDWPKSFNVSTAAAILAATLGVRVVKPVSPSTGIAPGSEDTLAALGIDPVESEGQIEESLDRVGIAFCSFRLRLPRFFRRYTGRFPFFNPLSFFLPPVASPGQTTHLVYGVAHRDQAGCARLLGALLPGRSIAVVGTPLPDRIVDELIPCAHSTFANRDGVAHRPFAETSACSELHEVQAVSVPEVLDPRAAGSSLAGARQIVVANAALYAHVVGCFESMDEARERALASLEGGHGHELLASLG